MITSVNVLKIMITSSLRIWKPVLALLALIVCTQPASATTYLFSIPESTIQNALAASIGANANLYAAYDISIRPIQAADIGGSQGMTGTALSNYTLSADGSPIPSGVDQWNADLNQHALSDLGLGSPYSTFLSVHFYFNALDSKIALITNNTNVAGKTYVNPSGAGNVTGEQMPGTDTFKIWMNSTDPNIAGPVNFLFYATGLQFPDSSATSWAGKNVVKGPIEFSSVGQSPEPSTIGMGLGGMVLMAVGYIRRRKASR